MQRSVPEWMLIYDTAIQPCCSHCRKWIIKYGILILNFKLKFVLYTHNTHTGNNMSPELIKSLHLFWNLAYTFALDDHWWPWPEFEFLYWKCFSVHRSSKSHFLKICTINFGDMMPKILFLCIGAKKIDLKICTQWPLVTLTWFWPDMMPKMLFLCIAAQK